MRQNVRCSFAQIQLLGKREGIGLSRNWVTWKRKLMVEVGTPASDPPARPHFGCYSMDQDFQMWEQEASVLANNRVRWRGRFMLGDSSRFQLSGTTAGWERISVSSHRARTRSDSSPGKHRRDCRSGSRLSWAGNVILWDRATSSITPVPYRSLADGSCIFQHPEAPHSTVDAASSERPRPPLSPDRRSQQRAPRLQPPSIEDL